MACSTCHGIFERVNLISSYNYTRNISLIAHLKEQYDMMPVPDEEEVDMLDLAWGLTDT
jgi:hypothetical protein